jgi:hypothetical protein
VLVLWLHARLGYWSCRGGLVGACRRLKLVELLPGNSADTQDIKPLAHAVSATGGGWHSHSAVLVVGLFGFVGWQGVQGFCG